MGANVKMQGFNLLWVWGGGVDAQLLMDVLFK